MGTQIAGTASSSSPSARQIVRSSDGQLIAGVRSSAGGVDVYTSSNGGSTWTNQTSVPAESTTDFSLAIDGSNSIHVSSRNSASTGDIIYNRLDPDTANSLDVSTESTTPSDVLWNSDGTKLYVVYDSIHEYNCSTAYDITTATVNQSESLLSSGGDGAAWNSDGTKLYVSSSLDTTVDEYTLSAAYDVSTLTHNFELDVSANMSFPNGLAWNADGTELNIITTGDDVHTYTLTAGYDLSTASHSTTTAFTLNTGRDVAFNSDGSKLYLLDGGDDIIYQYTTSTVYDPSTASLEGSFSVGTWAPIPRGMVFGASGSKLYFSCTNTDSVYGVSLGTAYDVTTVENDYSGMTNPVSDEIVFSNNNPVLSSRAHVDSSGTVYVGVQYEDKVMGTNYNHLKLFRRDGAASWTDLGTFASGEENHHRPALAIDGNDDVHIAWYDGGSGVDAWDMWDSSAASFVGQETVSSPGGDVSIVIDPANEEPLVASGVTERVSRRASGVWASGPDFTTHNIPIDEGATLTWFGSDLAVLFRGASDNIWYNTASDYDQFSSADETELEASAAVLTNPTTRWQFNNENDPATDQVDVLYFDSTNTDLYYSSVQASGGVQTQILSENIRVQKQ